MKECKMQQERTTPNREEISVLDFSEKKKKRAGVERSRLLRERKRERRKDRFAGSSEFDVNVLRNRNVGRRGKG